MKKLIISCSLGVSVVIVLLSAHAQFNDSVESDPKGEANSDDLLQIADQSEVAGMYVFAELGGKTLGLINIETDQLIQFDLSTLDNWPENSTTQHAWVIPNGRTVYLTVDAVESDPAAVVVLSIEQINWNSQKVDIVINAILPLDEPGMPSMLPSIDQTDPSQPIAPWTQPSRTQAHGPTFRPHSKFTYLTQWTDNRIRILNRETNELLEPQRFDDRSQQTHGVNFNPSGTMALGTGYFYDSHAIDVYQAEKKTSELTHVQTITLGHERAYSAFTHYTYWLNNRYALTASMQLAPTSLTPSSTEIIGPSVWLLDVRRGLAEPIIGTASSADEEGIFRSASDLVVAGFKLYVAEEDSLDESFGEDGYVSVFDISNIRQPSFLKRLSPGQDLPGDFAVAHGLNVTLDGRFVYVASYASHYILKINTVTDEVVKIFGPAEGINAPHGGFIAGQIR